MSCEGPFFKVKHFPGSLAQPPDAAERHPGCGAKTASLGGRRPQGLHSTPALSAPLGSTENHPAASPRGAEVARTRLGSGASAQRSLHAGNPAPAPPHRGETGGGAASPPTATSRSHPPRGKGRGPAGPFKGQPWVETPDPPAHPGCIQEGSS